MRWRLASMGLGAEGDRTKKSALSDLGRTVNGGGGLETPTFGSCDPCRTRYGTMMRRAAGRPWKSRRRGQPHPAHR